MIKKILSIFVLFLLCPIISKASSVEIVGLESIINVEKNRVANVEEKIDFYIIDDGKEYERLLNKKNFVYRKDNSKIYIDSKISNINSNNLIKNTSSNNMEIIKLGLKGKKDTIETIKLKYNYNLGKDTSNKYDEFYYEIVNNDNLTSNISFEITLPKDARINNIDFAINDQHNLNKDDISYVIEDNIITGYLNIMLNEKEKFTIRIELPDKYFIGAKDTFNYLSYLYLIIPFITLIIITIYWNKYAKKNKFKFKTTNEIPENFDPVEIAYLYKGLISESDLITDIILLANQGYLKIEENEDGYKLGNENTFKFIKTKQYEKNNAVQKLLFEGIFKEKDIVDLKDIEYGYSRKIIDTKNMIDNKDNKIKLFNININKIRKISLIMLGLSIIILNIEPIKQLTNSYIFVLFSSLLMIFGMFVIFIIEKKGLLKKLLGIIITLGIIGISIYSLIGQTQLIIIYILEIILLFISTIIYKKIPNRTQYGNKKLAQIKAFKTGLLSMTIQELEEKQKENNNYFYEMLPYAIVLGITNEWTLKGKNLIKKQPFWHITKEQFDLNKEIRFFRNVIYTTSKVMIKAIYAKKDSTQIEFK